MRRSLLIRFLFTLLPALVVVSLAMPAVWGREGLVARAHLKRQLAETTERLVRVERENQQLLLKLDQMENDTQVLERIVADELAWGRNGAVLYRFTPRVEATDDADE